MSEQPQQKQPPSKAPIIFFGLFFVGLCVLCAPPEKSTLSVLWDLFAGGVLIVEVGVVGVWILKKIL